MAGDERLKAARYGALTALAWALLATSGARADVPVWLDCYLPEVELECRDLQQAFVSSVPGVVLAEARPQITVELRVQEEAVGRVFYADFSGQSTGSGTRDRIEFLLSQRIPTAAGSERTLLLLVALLQKGMTPFLELDAPGTVTNGRLTLDLHTGDDARRTSRAPRWYLRPAFVGDITHVGLEKITLTGQLEANYSLPEWRFRLVSELIWERWDFQIPDGRLRGDFFRGDARFHVVKSLGQGFSFGVFGAVGREPQNNIESRFEGAYGLEWALAPFVRAGEANVGVRLTGLVVHDRYVTPNFERRSERTSFRPGMTPFARVHFARLDIEASFWSSLIVDRPSIWGWGGDVNIAVRLTEGLQFTVTGWFTHQSDRVLREPDRIDQLDDVTAAALGNDFGRFVMGVNTGLSYAIGNALLRSQDQRWR